MNSRLSSILHWTPRVLAILYIGFISLFALDVWDMDGTYWEKLGGFLIHLAPTYVIIAVTLVTWKWPLAGGIVFTLLAVVFSLLFRWEREWQTLLIMAGPLLSIGVLFIVDGSLHRVRLQPGF